MHRLEMSRPATDRLPVHISGPLLALYARAAAQRVARLARERREAEIRSRGWRERADLA